MNEPSEQPRKKLTLLQIVGSIFAGWFGVQTNANRERDFAHGSPSTFIYGGIIFAVLFVLFVWGIVQIVLTATGTQ
jgi:hypothetical protein